MVLMSGTKAVRVSIRLCINYSMLFGRLKNPSLSAILRSLSFSQKFKWRTLGAVGCNCGMGAALGGAHCNSVLRGGDEFQFNQRSDEGGEAGKVCFILCREVRMEFRIDNA